MKNSTSMDKLRAEAAKDHKEWMQKHGKPSDFPEEEQKQAAGWASGFLWGLLSGIVTGVGATLIMV